MSNETIKGTCPRCLRPMMGTHKCCYQCASIASELRKHRWRMGYLENLANRSTENGTFVGTLFLCRDCGSEEIMRKTTRAMNEAFPTYREEFECLACGGRKKPIQLEASTELRKACGCKGTGYVELDEFVMPCFWHKPDWD